MRAFEPRCGEAVLSVEQLASIGGIQARLFAATPGAADATVDQGLVNGAANDATAAPAGQTQMLFVAAPEIVAGAQGADGGGRQKLGRVLEPDTASSPLVDQLGHALPVDLLLKTRNLAMRRH